jgi:RNA polymerase sigma factor (sigma-70 family)
MSDVRTKLEVLYANQHKKLVKFFKSRCDGNIMDAEDIVQEGFTRALTYIDSAPRGSNKELNDWLFKICHNAFKSNRKEKRLGGASDIDELEEVVDFSPDDEEMRYARQLLRCSDKLTQGLDEEVRKGINLHFFKGYRCSDLSKLLGGSPKSWERSISKVRESIVDLAKRQGYFSKGHWVPVRS